ncbi:ferrous iron transport protein A [Chromobacterium paludis]|uniref:Ferrous iron transport protein A n=2 Tax=Chromobacterium paludis TaxID=2605945 RepID=A0A5C1DJN5_9NEIS|nr:ferrous iron transport protein A [Chromobacterium paludis]
MAMPSGAGLISINPVRGCDKLSRVLGASLDIIMQIIPVIVRTRTIMSSLDLFPAGAHGIVEKLNLAEEAFRRVAAFGLVPGSRFHLRKVAPWGGPLLLEVGATRFLLRRSLARLIDVRAAA